MKICVVISDCDDKTIKKIRNCNLTNVFGKPKKEIRNEMSQCVADITGWLTKNASIDNGNEVRWWQEIKYNGLMMPFACVRMFNINLTYKEYVKQRCFLNEFEKLLVNEFGKSSLNGIMVDDASKCQENVDKLYKHKREKFKFRSKWQSYLITKRQHSQNEGEKYICKAAKSKVSSLLQIFIQFCIFNFKHNGNEYNAWLNSEYLFILNEQCNRYNQRLVHRLEKCIENNKEMKTKISDSQANKMLDKLANCEITSYDFVSNCDILFRFGQLYQEKFGKDFSNGARLKKMIQHYKLFCKRLFVQGTPVTFTNSLNNDINDEFVYHVFGGLNNDDKKRLNKQNSTKHNTSNAISVAIAGPQSSGKSTLLRRLFGIDARVSAGKTTKGINCCRVGLNLKNNESKNDNENENVDLMLVDTEGINSIESSNSNEMENRKRNNKIMLGALASCNVFLFNIKNDPSDAKLLDVILWAYEKLDLKTAGRLQPKYLSDIKFIFVIRDVKEFSDTKWLEKQKRKVTEYLNESIKLSPKYIENEWNTINSIEDLIGEPEYFPMPNAFDTNDAPNPQFSQRCVELRDKILANFSDDGLSDRYGFKYDNAFQWSKNMIGIWRSIVQLETILCVSDFRQQSMIKILRKHVKTQLNELRDGIRDRVVEMIQECLHSNSNHIKRCERFEEKITDLVYHERDKYLKYFDEPFKAMEISESTIETYKQEFRNQTTIVILERKKHFHYKSRSKEALEIENNITRLLNNLAQTLRNEEIKNESEISKRYWDSINKNTTDYEEENSQRIISNQIEKRFDQTYTTLILKPNRKEGKSPSSLDSVKSHSNTDKIIKYAHNIKNNSNDSKENDCDFEKNKEDTLAHINSQIDDLVNNRIASPLKEVYAFETKDRRSRTRRKGSRLDIRKLGSKFRARSKTSKTSKTTKTIKTSETTTMTTDNASLNKDIGEDDSSCGDVVVNFSNNNSWDDAHA